MPDIFDVADGFRRELLAGERAAAVAMVEAYGAVWAQLRARLDALAAQVAAARAAGAAPAPTWLFRQERLEALQQQVAAEIGRFAQAADGLIQDQQRAAVAAAQQHAEQLGRTGLGPPPPGVTVTWARLPREALQDLVGFLSDGSPLRALLDELGPDAAAAVRRALITGLATGQNPRAIARQVRAALGGSLVRALTISRTEVLRSYREASRRSYLANDDVVRGWVWRAGLGVRTCAFCWAQHGSFHPATERLSSHPRCRCVMVPVTRPWAELGFPGVPDRPLPIDRGPDLFAALPPAQQRQILGPAKYEAYRAGRLALAEVAGVRDDPRWGRVGFERPLRDIVGAEEARRLRHAARAG